jgi:hypothetical protein
MDKEKSTKGQTKMLTCRLYLPKIGYALCSIRYVDPKVVRILVRFHQNKSSMVFIKIPSGQPIPMNTMFDLFWWGTAFGSTYPKWTHLDQKVIHHQNQLSIVFIEICCTSAESIKCLTYVGVWWGTTFRTKHSLGLQCTLCLDITV